MYLLIILPLHFTGLKTPYGQLDLDFKKIVYQRFIH